MKVEERRPRLTRKAARRAPVRKTPSKPRPGPTKPTEEDIALCAYLIWETEGRPEGRQESHWRQAQAHLSARYVHDLWLALPLHHHR
jgi:hypothetical protein